MPRKGSINQFSKQTLDFAREFARTQNWIRLSVNRVRQYIDLANEDAKDRGYSKRTKRSQELFLDDVKSESLRLFPVPEVEEKDDQRTFLNEFGRSNIIDFEVSDVVEEVAEEPNFGFVEFYDEDGNLLYQGFSPQEFNDALRDYKVKFSVYVEMSTNANFSLGQVNLVVQITNTYPSV